MWDRGHPYLNVIGLNPSTADETLDDPTVRRCIGFAQRWGFGGLWVTNLFAIRSKDPSAIQDTHEAGCDPIGPENDIRIVGAAQPAGKVVLAWGVHGCYLERSDQVIRLLHNRGVKMAAFGYTQAGHPKHPLYIANSTPTVEHAVGA